MNFNNIYILVVIKEIVEKYNLKIISDIVKVGNKFNVIIILEFLNREDGLLGLINKYNFNFNNIVGIDGILRYLVLINNESDVIDVFLIDGLLKKYNLIVLKDDKNFFLLYYVIFVVCFEVLEKYLEIKLLVEEVGNLIINDVMIELNYDVDELKKDFKDVVIEFL